MEERPSQYCYIQYMKSTSTAIANKHSCLALDVEEWEVAVFTVGCTSVRSRLCFWVIDWVTVAKWNYRGVILKSKKKLPHIIISTSKAAGNNKIINGFAQEYLSDLLETYVPTHSLRFATQGFLAVPKSLNSTYADWACTVAAPKLWYNLPVNIRATSFLDSIKRKLKIHFFQDAFL